MERSSASESKSFQCPLKFSTGLGGKNGWAIPNWNRYSYLIQMPTVSCTQFRSMHCIRFGSWKVWQLNWHGPYITVTDLSTTLFWQPVLWLWRWLMHRLPEHQSIQQQSYLGQGYEPGWSYSTYSHVWNDSRVQTIHFKRTLLIFCGCLNHHKGVFKVSCHGNYP